MITGVQPCRDLEDFGVFGLSFGAATCFLADFGVIGYDDGRLDPGLSCTVFPSLGVVDPWLALLVQGDCSIFDGII